MAARKKKRRVTDDELGIVRPTDEVVQILAERGGITEADIEEMLEQEMRKADAIRRYLPRVLQTTRRRKRTGNGKTS